MKSALITGCFGFLGSHFKAELQKRDYHVYGWDQPSYDLMEMINRTSKKPDLIIHAAVRNAWQNAITTQPGNSIYNTMIDAAMFDFAVRNEVEKFLYISSCAIYDDALSVRPFHEKAIGNSAPDVYGAVKRHGEILASAARKCGVKVTVVRPFNIYGPSQSDKFIFGAFIKNALARVDPFTIWGSLHQVRDFIHIDDVINGALTLIDNDVQESVNLCTGVPTRLDILAHMIIGEIDGYDPVITVDKELPMGVFQRVGDPTNLHRWYHPNVSLIEGIRRALSK